MDSSSEIQLSKHLLIPSLIRVSANLLLLQACSSPHFLRKLWSWISIIHLDLFRYWESLSNYMFYYKATQLLHVWVSLDSQVNTIIFYYLLLHNFLHSGLSIELFSHDFTPKCSVILPVSSIMNNNEDNEFGSCVMGCPSHPAAQF